MSFINKISFWITNISPMNVSLADLALNIKSFTTINLLDQKHYKYTLDQLQKSASSGSLFKKRNKIIIRNNPPSNFTKDKILIQKEAIIPSRERSLYNIKEEHYEELNISDDDYIKENSEITETDAQKISKKV